MSGKSEKAQIGVWLGSAVGTVSLATAAILPSLGHAKPAVWVTYVAILGYIVAGWTYVTHKRQIWKSRATRIALALAIGLFLAFVWLVRSIVPPAPNNPPATSVHVESSGDQSPNVVGNQGSVTIENQQPPSPDKKSKKKSGKAEGGKQ
ncbi:MAG TPA: hypothetical protein VMT28_14450 [Terriglobales bacterium]|jgi:hypothetical protein|nr:hypothetical protein [Terriglobales bacterium]